MQETASIRTVLRKDVAANKDSGAWRSLVARCNGVAKVAGSNPVAPTKIIKNRRFGENQSAVFCWLVKYWEYFGKTVAPVEAT